MQLLQAPQKGERITEVHELVKVFTKHYSAKDKFWIVDVMTVTSLAHLILNGEGKWLVNNRIDLKMFNDIYYQKYNIT